MISGITNQIRQDMMNMDKGLFPSGACHASVAILGKSRWIAHNTFKSDPNQIREFGDGVSVSRSHAEINVLSKVPRQSRKNVKVFVMRIKRNGQLTMSKP